jgi:hypothetical protein
MKIKSFLPLLCLIGIVVCCLLSCDPVQKHSEIPEIHFKQLIFENRTDGLDETFKVAVLTFSFIDGDGDLGVMPGEKNPDDTYKPGGGFSRIHYTWYQKKTDNTYDPYQFKDGDIAISSEIPYKSVMDRSEAQNKVLKGTIEIELVTPKKPQGIDEMRVEFYIVDRAKNKSNIEYTPDFSILNPPEEILPQ